MDLGLKNKRVVITGASRGLGSSVADFFESEGSLLTLISRDKDSLAKKISKYKNFKNKHNFFSFDLRKNNNAKIAAEKVLKKNKKIDIVIHNVGGGLGVKNYLDKKEKWIDVWNFNVGIAIEMNNIFLPHMKKKNLVKLSMYLQ